MPTGCSAVAVPRKFPSSPEEGWRSERRGGVEGVVPRVCCRRSGSAQIPLLSRGGVAPRAPGWCRGCAADGVVPREFPSSPRRGGAPSAGVVPTGCSAVAVPREFPSSPEEGWRPERRGGEERSARQTTHAPSPNPASPARRGWRMRPDAFSGVGGLGEGAVGGLEAQGLGAFAMVDYFLAQPGDEVEAGRAVGFASPRSTCGAKRLGVR